MATAPVATQQAQPLPMDQAGALLANIDAFLKMAGGTKTTTSTNAGDTAALQQALAGLKGADYQALLDSVFQQAAGKIPQLQAAYGNAMGARSGTNSAVQVALNNLLKDTALAGQKQIADQQLANLQTQVQAGGAVAQATKGTQQTQQSGTNVGAAASNTAKAAALLQLLGAGTKLTGSNTIQEAWSKLTGGNPAAAYTDAAGNYVAPNTPGDQDFMNFMTQAAQPVTAAPQMSMAPAQQFSPAVTAALQQLGIGTGTAAMSTPDMATPGSAPVSAPSTDTSGPQMSFADWYDGGLDINSIIGSTPAAPDMSYAPTEWFTPAFNINDYLY